MAFLPYFERMDTKDRIKQIMEDQHMTQQVFADFLQQSPATLSSIFNGRTRPTLNIVDSIKTKFPDISIEWLLYGEGDMYVSHPEEQPGVNSEISASGQEQMLIFDTVPSEATVSHPAPRNIHSEGRNIHQDYAREEIKLVEKEPRRVTEIRVYYDDQTYETFVPAKK